MQAEKYIKHHGKKKVILILKEKYPHIFAIEYSGAVLASPLHPEMLGTNQFYFKDASGKLAVQEEIIKAKCGKTHVSNEKL